MFLIVSIEPASRAETSGRERVGPVAALRRISREVFVSVPVVAVEVEVATAALDKTAVQVPGVPPVVHIQPTVIRAVSLVRAEGDAFWQ
jgi:hypothetical protein